MKPTVPTPEQCEELLASNNVPEEIISHSRKVEYTALRIGRDLKWLRDRGPNIALLRAAALLHDIAKGQPNHAVAGAELLRNLGYDTVADVVEVHNDIEYEGDLPVTEKEIIFIADKLVLGDQLVTVKFIYDHKLQARKGNPEAVADLEKRRKIAMNIKKSIEHETGKNLEELAIAEN